MRRVLLLMTFLFAPLSHAGEWVPTIYPLRDGLIPALDVAGDVVVSNAQDSEAKQVIYKYAFTKLESSYKAITETMVEQTRGELAKNGQPKAATATGAGKSIGLKVVYMGSSYKMMYWKSKLRFEATLGDGTVVTKEVPHASGNPIQDLNGCIAESVMTLLNDEQVRAYLAS